MFAIRKLINKGCTVKLNDKEILIHSGNSGKIIKKWKFDGMFWWLDFDLVEFFHSNNKFAKIESYYHDKKITLQVEKTELLRSKGDLEF